jgi:hypothetical protein
VLERGVGFVQRDGFRMRDFRDGLTSRAGGSLPARSILVAISDKMNSNLLRACRLALCMIRTLSPRSRNREFPRVPDF